MDRETTSIDKVLRKSNITKIFVQKHAAKWIGYWTQDQKV